MVDALKTGFTLIDSKEPARASCDILRDGDKTPTGKQRTKDFGLDYALGASKDAVSEKTKADATKIGIGE